MKKQLLILLALTLPLIASADDMGSCGKNVTYTYIESTHTLTISGTGTMNYYFGSYHAPGAQGDGAQLLCLQHEKLPLSAKGALEKVSFC